MKVSICICGAGMAGISAAHFLATRFGQTDILLVDAQSPMSLTTARSGENFRDYWPQQCMTSFATRSLDLVDELATAGGVPNLVRRSGYHFVSESADADIFPAEDLARTPDALTRLTSTRTIAARYPYLSHKIRQVVHVHRAGAFDVHLLGSLMLSLSRRAGVQSLRAEVQELERVTEGGFRVHVSRCGQSMTIAADQLVLATGPFLAKHARWMGIELPVDCYLQRKLVVPDPAALIPSDMPFLIMADRQRLNWTDEERELLAADESYRWVLQEFPAGLHIKPEPGGRMRMGWAYNNVAERPVWQPQDQPEFVSVVLRGAMRMIPALAAYDACVPTPIVQYAGYYTRTKENWPLIGRLDTDLYVIGALSGFGTMCGCAAGELLACWMTDATLPEYAPHFDPLRYSNPEMIDSMAAAISDGQL